VAHAAEPAAMTAIIISRGACERAPARVEWSIREHYIGLVVPEVQSFQ
jgi:hypothetical protein